MNQLHFISHFCSVVRPVLIPWELMHSNLLDGGSYIQLPFQAVNAFHKEFKAGFRINEITRNHGENCYKLLRIFVGLQQTKINQTVS
jgi:hypothetical protein